MCYKTFLNKLFKIHNILYILIEKYIYPPLEFDGADMMPLCESIIRQCGLLSGFKFDFRLFNESLII